MRAKFFLYLLVTLILLVVAYFVFMVVRAFHIVIVDFFKARELDRLSTELAEARARKHEEAEMRLKGPCQHLFDDDGGALPPDVCCKCGMAKVQPEGDCDHRWQRLPGIIPKSACTKCGQDYSSVTSVR